MQEAIERPWTDGVVTFDQSLYEFNQNRQISMEGALRNAKSERNLRLKIQLEGTAAKHRQEIGSTLHTLKFWPRSSCFFVLGHIPLPGLMSADQARIPCSIRG